MVDERPCAVCNRPAKPEYRPFCSKRCADVDLNRWLSEQYRIPTEEPPDGEEPPPDA
ncbi:DNA gyrase inhibitor YacG [Hwanghaeella grinnelliae]|uniref:DNA gyrase inhibitor YacG n=1 Tax=Hwanghaeella grinnelliae TaxID=2500179 RepID=A0A437QZ59_9PROT|nr:DNA gyrase inhibitor YacG [Hwanghaeella grinnelliae]